MKKIALILAIPALMLMSACAADIGANQYDSASVGSVTKALKGTVISVRSITVRDSNKSGGTAIGAIAGGIAGSQIGKGNTAALIGGTAGALLGGAAGNLAQGSLSSQGGYEYVVQLDNGGIITVTQGNDVLLANGRRCMVLYGNGSSRARIIPYNGY